MPVKKKKLSLMSLRARILLYTVTPVLLIIIISGGFLTLSVRSIIDSISRSDAWGGTALVCSRIDGIIGDIGDIAVKTAGSEALGRFLYTAEDRDDIENNAYFSYAIGELDAVLSAHPDILEASWLISFRSQGVAFSNSSCGWTAPADFTAERMPFALGSQTVGGFTITDPYKSPVSGRTAVSAVSPVKDPYSGNIIGIFGADISLDGLHKKISSLPEAKGSEMIVAASDTSMIYHKNTNNLHKRFDTLGLKETSYGVFSDGKTEYAGSVHTPSYCGWSIYALRDYSEAKQTINEQTKLLITTLSAVAAILTAALSICSGMIARPIKDYTEKINSIDINGSDETLLVPEGCKELEQLAEGFNGLITKNREMFSSLKEMNIRSEKEARLYQTALQGSSEVVFEYHIESDTLITYGSVFDPDLPKTVARTNTAFLEKVMAGDVFKPFDREKAESFFKGKPWEEAIISRTAPDGTVNWISFTGVNICSENIPVQIVGKISRADNIMALRSDADRDGLTGLYNKTATERIIAERLAMGGSHAVILIDADNFKSINDIFGHAYGDFVIKDVASKISSETRKGDIVGRIGGDEFMLFISGEDVKERLPIICEAIRAKIRHTYLSDDTEKQINVSASIGAAVSPDHGSDFGELYSCADIAMYTSKNSGKDRVTLYSGQKRSEYTGSRED